MRSSDAREVINDRTREKLFLKKIFFFKRIKLKQKHEKDEKPNRTFKHQATIEVVDVHQGEAEDEETRVSFLFTKRMFTLFSFSTSKLMNLNFPCFRYRHLQT